MYKKGSYNEMELFEEMYKEGVETNTTYVFDDTDNFFVDNDTPESIMGNLADLSDEEIDKLYKKAFPDKTTKNKSFLPTDTEYRADDLIKE